MGLSIPYYFETVLQKDGRGPIRTDSTVLNNILNSIFHTAAAVALLLTLLLDNTIPGSDEERGLQHMLSLVKGPDGEKVVGDWWEDNHLNRVSMLKQ
jgi:nucleobase transporter 1/2